MKVPTRTMLRFCTEASFMLPVRVARTPFVLGGVAALPRNAAAQAPSRGQKDSMIWLVYAGSVRSDHAPGGTPRFSRYGAPLRSATSHESAAQYSYNVPFCSEMDVHWACTRVALRALWE
jgi:hypothetical protein